MQSKLKAHADHASAKQRVFYQVYRRPLRSNWACRRTKTRSGSFNIKSGKSDNFISALLNSSSKCQIISDSMSRLFCPIISSIVRKLFRETRPGSTCCLQATQTNSQSLQDLKTSKPQALTHCIEKLKMRQRTNFIS